MAESFRLLASVIAAHPDRGVVGRTRLQKTVKLLQRLGLKTAYGYSIHFYGPYSEDLQSDVTLLEVMGSAKEEAVQKQSGDGIYYVIRAGATADPKLVKEYQPKIDIMAKTDQTVLELAATYDAFRESGSGHSEAVKRLRRKKGEKCKGGNEEKALALLEKLGIGDK